MVAQGPLRRWKRFFAVFDTIDASIVAAGENGCDEIGCAEVLRQAKADVVQLLCDAPEDDPAEDLCRILDDVMVEYLVTLESVPVTPITLASTGLAKAVGSLQEHESEQIRRLARGTVGRWRASVETDLAEARARVEELRKLSDETLATKTSRPSAVGHCHVPVASIDGEKKKKQVEDEAIRSSNLVETDRSNVPAKVSPQLPMKSAPGRAYAVSTDKTMVPMKMPAVVGNGGRDRAGIDKESAKRKIGAGYQEAGDAKRQRVIEAPKMVKQQQKMVEQEQRPAKISAPPLLKKSVPVVGVGRASTATMDKKMEATKRKLQASYRETEAAKRQRRIIVIEAPKMVEQRQGKKMHAVIRGRSQQVRCVATSTAVRRSLMPSFCRV